MKKLLLATAIGLASTSSFASIETKDWYDEASSKAKQFVKDNIVLDFYASPSGTGFIKDSQVADYIDLAHERGITGASATIAAPNTPNLLAFKS
ncbi:hypothetical protein L1D55_27175 [Vibrio sp. Isolate22]|uniref:hypothetical protein n=1 Tax=Vibrio sp. Isolate22 TaxID=2908532 RepID=UPI001EFD0D69|nr:hypothetical protein [Vibrio sp. Isolate22]MCG9695305.1 hypothetical protein [Vibrio sp. Isolate22]